MTRYFITCGLLILGCVFCLCLVHRQLSRARTQKQFLLGYLGAVYTCVTFSALICLISMQQSTWYGETLFYFGQISWLFSHAIAILISPEEWIPGGKRSVFKAFDFSMTSEWSFRSLFTGAAPKKLFALYLLVIAFSASDQLIRFMLAKFLPAGGLEYNQGTIENLACVFGGNRSASGKSQAIGAVLIPLLLNTLSSPIVTVICPESDSMFLPYSLDSCEHASSADSSNAPSFGIGSYLLYAYFEEVGWSRIVYPSMTRLCSSTQRASMYTGLLWSVWHLPLVIYPLSRCASCLFSGQFSMCLFPLIYALSFTLSCVYARHLIVYACQSVSKLFIFGNSGTLIAETVSESKNDLLVSTFVHSVLNVWTAYFVLIDPQTEFYSAPKVLDWAFYPSIGLAALIIQRLILFNVKL